MASESDLHPEEAGSHGCGTVQITEDGIYSNILSCLTLRDAVQTSILSKKFKNLWTFIPDLWFDGDNMLDYNILTHPDFKHMSQEGQELLVETTVEKFISSVNQFLRHHKFSPLNMFYVKFIMDQNHACHLDQWVEHAIGSRTMVFVLDLLRQCGSYTLPFKDGRYEFPLHLFANGRGSSIVELYLCYVKLSLPDNFTGFSSVRKLFLRFIFMTESDLEVLISSCPALEILHLRNMPLKLSLMIYHRGLKELKVEGGPPNIQINSETLTRFIFIGPKPFVKFTGTSRISIARFLLRLESYAPTYCLSKLAGDLPLLEFLVMEISWPFKEVVIPYFCKFTHLKKLILFAVTALHADIRGLAIMLSVAPFLEKLHVHVRRRPSSGTLIEEQETGSGILTELPPSPYDNHSTLQDDCTYSNLKEFEFGGYTDSLEDINVVRYVIGNSAALKLVTVDPRRWYLLGDWTWYWTELERPSSDAGLPNAYKFLTPIAVARGVKLVIRLVTQTDN